MLHDIYYPSHATMIDIIMGYYNITLGENVRKKISLKNLESIDIIILP